MAKEVAASLATCYGETCSLNILHPLRRMTAFCVPVLCVAAALFIFHVVLAVLSGFRIQSLVVEHGLPKTWYLLTMIPVLNWRYLNRLENLAKQKLQPIGSDACQIRNQISGDESAKWMISYNNMVFSLSDDPIKHIWLNTKKTYVLASETWKLAANEDKINIDTSYEESDHWCDIMCSRDPLTRVEHWELRNINKPILLKQAANSRLILPADHGVPGHQALTSVEIKSGDRLIVHNTELILTRRPLLYILINKPGESQTIRLIKGVSFYILDRDGANLTWVAAGDNGRFPAGQYPVDNWPYSLRLTEPNRISLETWPGSCPIIYRLSGGKATQEEELQINVPPIKIIPGMELRFSCYSLKFTTYEFK